MEDPTQELSAAELAAVAAVAAWITASGAATIPPVPPVPVLRRLVRLGLSARAVRAVVRLIAAGASAGVVARLVGVPRQRRHPGVSMARMTAAREPLMRARYLLNASKRLTRALQEGRFTPALARERTYLAAHLNAQAKRAKVADDYDRAATRTRTGRLRWVARLDDRTSPDCRARHGDTWPLDDPPYPPPGAVHLQCRCRARPA